MSGKLKCVFVSGCQFSPTAPEEADRKTSKQKYTNPTLVASFGKRRINTGYSLLRNGSGSADAIGTERKSQKKNERGNYSSLRQCLLVSKKKKTWRRDINGT